MELTFTEKIKTIIKLITEPSIIRILLSFRAHGYLVETGWFDSFKMKMPVNKKKEPIPWVTYSFIDFIESRLLKNFSILEFGSGNSTLFYAKRVKEVVTIEGDYDWYLKIKNEIPSNVRLIYSDSTNIEEYSSTPFQLDTKYDLIIIDGANRNECVFNSVKNASKTCVIVLDDSEREEYAPGIDSLQSNGYKRLDFWGIAPGTFFRKNTTLFYRENNCLGV